MYIITAIDRHCNRGREKIIKPHNSKTARLDAPIFKLFLKAVKETAELIGKFIPRIKFNIL